MAKPHKQPRDDDAEAFRAAVKDVQPLPHTGRVVHSPERPTPLPRQREQDDRQVLADSLSSEPPVEAALESGEALAYVREGMSTQVLRKLRAGVWSVQDELDLHGLRSEEARELLAQFLAGALRRGQRCVRIIHGKGSRSHNNEPVLKRKVAGWLRQRAEVLAYCEARPAEGGSGAVVVLLQARGGKNGARGSRHEARDDDAEI
jgi:DNA-nicking Smr family endonuclease